MVEDGIHYSILTNQRAITHLLLRIFRQTLVSITTTWSYKLSISFMRFHPLLTKLRLAIEKNVGNQRTHNNSSITDYTLVKLHVHNHTMVIYIQNQFHEKTYVAYKAMAEDGINH